MKKICLFMLTIATGHGFAYTDSAKPSNAPKQYSTKDFWRPSYKITVHNYSNKRLFDIHFIRIFVIHKHRGFGGQSKVCITEVYQPKMIQRPEDASPKEIVQSSDILYADCDYIIRELASMAKEPNNPNNIDKSHILVNKKLNLYRCRKTSRTIEYRTVSNNYELQALFNTNGIPIDTSKHKIIASTPQPLQASEWAKEVAMGTALRTVTIVAPEVTQEEIDAAIEEARKSV